MVPVAATLAAENGLDAVGLIVSLTLGMCATSLSPISTGGATVLSCQTGYEGRETKLYSKQFIMAIIYAAITLVWCFLGLFLITDFLVITKEKPVFQLKILVINYT